MSPFWPFWSLWLSIISLWCNSVERTVQAYGFGFAALAYATMVLYGSQIVVNWVESDIGIWTGYLYKITSIAGLVLVVALGNLYLAIFRLLLLERVMRVLTWFAIGTGGVILILALPVFEQLRYVWDFAVFVTLILAVVDIVKRSIKRERFALLMFTGFCVVTVTAIHDLSMVYGYLSSIWLSQYGFLAFMVIQSYLLAVRNAEAHKLAERLSENLQGEVEAQTHALQTQTVEAEHLRKLAEKQAVELREYDARKTRFFQNISHELRTPLTLMLHPLDAALKTHGDDENLVVARRNCGRLLRLVNQLLDFQKLSAGTQTLELEPVDAVSFLRVASDYFASSSAHRSLSFSVTIDGEPISTTERQVGVVGELDALEKVIFNYLSNAMKFSPG